MKNKEDKYIEKLVENLMDQSSPETPPMDFTTKVMSQVLSAEKSKALVYRPVISKKAWFIIFGVIVALFAFLLLNLKTTPSAFNIDLSVFSFDKRFNPYPGLHISPMTANILLVATLMLFVQIFLLKNYLNKRFEK